MGRNHTGPPCSVCCPTADTPGAPTAHAADRPAGPLAALQTLIDDADRRRRQTTDAKH